MGDDVEGSCEGVVEIPINSTFNAFEISTEIRHGLLASTGYRIAKVMRNAAL